MLNDCETEIRSLTWEDCFEKAGLVTGVPDSLLAPFISRIPKTVQHISAANEGSALALASGFGLATQLAPIVYMQNSGLGNALNPLVSLAHKDVYRSPLVLVIGWRGEPNEITGKQVDEPQHNAMGSITQKILELVGARTRVADENAPFTPSFLMEAMERSRTKKGPEAVLVRKSGIENLKEVLIENQYTDLQATSRRDYIEQISKLRGVFFIATTGQIAREMMEVCKRRGMSDRLFMVTGAMGHAISVATGFALAYPDRSFVVLDGDGSLQMHLGAASLLGKLHNLSYVVLNNHAHASVGGQSTSAPNMKLSTLLQFFVQRRTDFVDSIYLLNKATKHWPFFVECETDCSVSPNLSRPNVSHEQMAFDFRQALERN